MRRGIRLNKTHALAALLVLCSAFVPLLGITTAAQETERFQKGDSLTVQAFAYREAAKETWVPDRGSRYYWTRTKRENTVNQAYMVQYNGHIASSRVSLTQTGVRPAFVLKKEGRDIS